MGKQFDKQHATTVVLSAAVEKARFVGFDGAHATSAGGLHDSQGVSEYGGALGEAISVVTGYTALVEAGAVLAKGDYLKPHADGSGRAIVGTVADRCGRAMAAAQIGQVVEVQIHTHIRPAA